MNDAAPVSAAPTPAAKRKTRTRPALYNALLELLGEKSFDQITIREITARANLGYATFFRHYPDKDVLLHDLAEDEIRKLMSITLPVLYTADARTFMQTRSAYLWENRKIWSALLTGGAAGIVKEEYLRQAREVTTTVPVGSTWLPTSLHVAYSVTAMIEILTWWLRQEDPPSVEWIAEVMNVLVAEPIFTRPAFMDSIAAKPDRSGS